MKPPISYPASLNYLWSSLIVRSLAAQGLTHYVVSPGYRNAPMISALQRHANLVSVVSCWDERAAAFQALGYARATEKPAILLCTSGTAAANYFPAVIEASQDQVPICLLTADRPFEMRHAATNQVIDQVGLFGRYVKQCWAFPEPTTAVQPQVVLNDCKAIGRQLASFPQGPVHVNLPFREPLEPAAEPGDDGNDDSDYALQMESCFRRPMGLAGGWSETPREWAADSDVLAELIQDIHAAERPLVLFGRLSRQVEITAATAWLKTLRCPVYLDVTSSLKGVAPSIAAPASGQAWEWLAAYRPDCVIQFGQRLVTKSFDRFFGRLPPARFWCFSRECQWQDAAGCGLRHEQVNLGQLLVQLGECDLAPVGKALTARSAMPATAGEALSWPIIVEECLQQLPAEMPLMLGNSQTIRAFDEYDWSAAGPRRIFANRGVSGIEGLVSTTVGLAEGAQQPITVVLGDVSLIHDLNALLSVAGASQPVTVIVVNDGGGGIFQRLPIARYPEITDPLMTTPHGFEFSGLANMAGILYQQVTTRAELQAALSHSKDSASRLVEVVMPSHGDSKVGR